MASIIKFVDKIDAAPTTRLDLNDGAIWITKASSDFSPPPLRRSLISTMLADGERIPAAAYGNRTIRLTLMLGRSTADLAAAQLSLLAAELNRPTNFLKVQLEGASAPVFFRTFRAPDYVLANVVGSYTTTEMEIEIPAEPFAYGLRVDVAAKTVTSDPAAGTNGCYFDVTGVTGDVETPPLIRVTNYTSSVPIAIGVRRNAPTFDDIRIFAQTETAVGYFGADTALAASNDPLMSGAGNNYIRITPVAATEQLRVSIPMITGTAARGTYHVFARVRRSSSAAVWSLRQGTVETATTWAAGNAGPAMVDVGLFGFPPGGDPGVYGPGTELAIENGFVHLYAARLSGAGTLDVDYLVLVPADDRFAMIGPFIVGGGQAILDSMNEAVYQSTRSGTVDTLQVPLTVGSPGVPWVGGLPMLSPGGINRVVVLGNVDPASTEPLTDTVTFDVTYWPRYLVIA